MAIATFCNLLTKKIQHVMGFRLLMVLVGLFFISSQVYSQTAENPEQGSNGTVAAPLAVTFQNGNLNQQNAHFLEGHSIPYRLTMTGLIPGQQYILKIGMDALEGGAAAIDYVTSIFNLTPHDYFGHPAENINPLINTGYIESDFGAANVQHIPLPAPVHSPPAMGLDTYFGNGTWIDLAAEKKEILLFGASAFGSVWYDAGLFDYTLINTGNVTQPIYLTIHFTAGPANAPIGGPFTSTTAILAWGGHISSQLDYGLETTAATEVQGSPYHTRRSGFWNGDSTIIYGNEGADRSVQIDAIIICVVTPGSIGTDQTVCCTGGDPALLTSVTAGSASGTLTYQWISNTVSCASTSPWAQIPGATSATYDPPSGITQTTFYKRVAYSDADCSDTSNCVTVTVGSDPPVFTNPPGNITITCAQAPPQASCLAYTNSATGPCLISGCVTSTFTGSHNACGGTYTETWSFTDNCGRTITHSRRITVSPAAQAQFTSPPGNITITCAQAPPQASCLAYTNSASGSCLISGCATSTFTGSHNACGGTYTETWSFTDNCGRTTTHSRRITVSPAAQAQFTSPPGNITITCAQAPPQASCLAYTNSASGSCLISGCATSTFTGSHNACGGTYTETWSFTDNCGRTTTHSRRITVSPAPQAQFTSPPGNITITCAQAPPQASCLAYTNGGSGSCLISGCATSTFTGSHNACGGTYTETWSVTDNCGRTTTHSRRITVSPAPQAQFTSPPGNITITCAQAPPQASCLAYTNGASGSCLISGCATSTFTGSHNACGGTYTETWSFTDNCGRTTTHSRRITVSPAAQAQFTSPPGNITITCAQAPPQASCLAYTNGASGSCLISGCATSTFTGTHNACGGTYTETWSFTDNCGRTTTHTRRITVSPAPQAQFTSPPGNITITCAQAPPSPSCLAYTNSASGTCLISGCVTSTITGSYTNCGGLYTETWSFTDQCSRNITHTRTIRVSPAPQATPVNPPGNVVSTVCGVAPLPSQLTFSNGLSGTCLISGTVTSTITGSGNCGVFTETWVFADPCGRGNATRSRTITVPCCSDALCTYTQGAYGSTGGMMCNGEPANPGPNQFNTFDFITNSINNYSINSYTPPLSNTGVFVNDVLVIGKENEGKTVYMNSSPAHVDGIIDMLPGGGPSVELIAGHYPITNLPDAYLNLNNGRIGNTLLAQTITLGLNLGIGTDLGNFVLQGGTLVTADVEFCGSNTPKPRLCIYRLTAPYDLINVINEYGYFPIDAAVVNAIPGSPKTVAGLFELANRALANVDDVVGKENNVNLSAIASVVDAINNAFDECRIFIGWNVPHCANIDPSAPTLIIPGAIPIAGGNGEIFTDKLTVDAFPNPFTDRVRFVIQSPVTGQGSLEVFNSLGQKIGVVYNGMIYGGRTQTYEYSVQPANRGNLFYLMRVGGQQVTGKLLNIQH